MAFADIPAMLECCSPCRCSESNELCQSSIASFPAGASKALDSARRVYRISIKVRRSDPDAISAEGIADCPRQSSDL
jgi:hypothetical protein